MNRHALIVVSVLGILTCHNNYQSSVKINVEKADSASVISMTCFKDLIFDSPKDLSFGMPLTAGVGDMSQYKGKLYGFCSKKCKEMPS